MADKNNNKKKSGLHKEISSIFDGVPVPDNRSAARPHGGPGGSEPGQAGYDSPRPPGGSLQNPRIPSGPSPYPGFRQPAGPTGSSGRVRAGDSASASDKNSLRQITKKLFKPKAGVSATRQKVMVLLVPILAVALILMLKNAIGPSSTSRTKPVPPKPATAISQSDTEIVWAKPEAYPSGLRDPMELTPGMKAQLKAAEDAKAAARDQTNTDPTQLQATGAGPLVVTGILYSEDNPSAVIGTRIAHIGDEIADAIIVNITKTAVEFERDGNTWTQTVEP